ncbi:DUF551 domain-containing protein [Escherichia coli]|uniref:DUF551 domain-containing protein n=1 Tax=Escherichia coli TaxID=562 RepID=UPI002023BD6A|nr:DUF551 domain-containing protein [Escherichia coli]HCY2044824.1 DUF551 domain-containing protein [Escherichia coli]
MTTITREQTLKIIEAADEVISALAGTNQDVHPGSDNMLRLWDDLNDRYAPPEVVRELARIALASLEAEPVAYIFKHPAGKLFWALTDESNKDQSDVIPVYAAPPVPVVPAALPENDDEDGHDIDYLEPSEVYSLGRTAGWNACRAAMLQSQGNCIKNGWISCSERMPAQDDWILIYSKHGEYMAGQVQGEYVELSDGTLSWLGNALYWMPLPEPPQEVN